MRTAENKDASGPATLFVAGSSRPHVLLLPPRSTDSPATLGEQLRRLRQTAPDTKVLVVTDRADPEFTCAILRGGAGGCISPTASREELAKAIQAVRAGEVWLQRRVLTGAFLHVLRQREAGVGGPRAASRDGLTRREQEIAAWVARGLTNKEVARELRVSHETIKKHLKRVFAKLGVRHRTEMILQHYG